MCSAINATIFLISLPNILACKPIVIAAISFSNSVDGVRHFNEFITHMSNTPLAIAASILSKATSAAPSLSKCITTNLSKSIPNTVSRASISKDSSDSNHKAMKSGSFAIFIPIVSSMWDVLPESESPATIITFPLGIPPPVISLTLNDGVGIQSIVNFSLISSSDANPITDFPTLSFILLIIPDITFFFSAKLIFFFAIN